MDETTAKSDELKTAESQRRRHACPTASKATSDISAFVVCHNVGLPASSTHTHTCVWVCNGLLHLHYIGMFRDYQHTTQPRHLHPGERKSVALDVLVTKKTCLQST